MFKLFNKFLIIPNLGKIFFTHIYAYIHLFTRTRMQIKGKDKKIWNVNNITPK